MVHYVDANNILDMKYTKKILNNGLRVITIPMIDNPTATVLVLVEAGPRYETKEISGISHFLEHLCFKGTKKRPTALEINQEFDGLGSQSSAFTGMEFTGYFAKAEAKKLPKILDIVSDIYVNPVFDETEIEKEKGVIIDEISMYEDMPTRTVYNNFVELLYGDQPAGWNIAGTKELVKGMKKEQIESYRAKHYVPKRTTVVIAGGGFDTKKIVASVEKKFSLLKGGQGGKMKRVNDTQDKPAIKVKYRETDQTHIMLGVRTFGQKNKSNPALSVLAAILGGGMSSRLFHRLRETMGVGYYVSASNHVSVDHGFLGINTGVNNERVNDVIKAIMEELSEMKDELVSEEELNKTKEYITGNIMLSLESSDSLAEYYGVAEILGRKLKLPKEKIKNIQSVTAADIRKVARKIFIDEHLNMVLIGPFKDGRKFTRTLHF